MKGSEADGNGAPETSATEPSHLEGKGKGPATGDPDQEATGQTDDESIVSRLGRSVAGLSKSVLQGAPSVTDLASVSASGKTRASSLNRSADAQAESSSTAAASSSFRTAPFRSGQADVHAAAEEAAFSEFLDNTDVFVPTEPAAPFGLEEAWKASSNTTVSTDAVGSSVADQQQRDGVEVVWLLSQMDEEVPDYEAQSNSSEAEIRSLRRALFEDGSPDQVSASDWNNMLNFVPDFLRGQGGAHGGDGASEATFMNLGLTDTNEAGQQWLGEWNRVLTSYNDEVWGDLGDLVQQAREEVRKISTIQDGETVDATALRRLQTVLTRVRARL